MKKTPDRSTPQIMSLYWRHAWRYPGRVIGLLISIPLSVLFFKFLPPLLIAAIIERMNRHDYLAGDVWHSFGTELMLFTAASFVGGVVLWRVSVWFLWTLEISVVRDIHQRIFHHLMSLSPSFHADRFAGSLVSQANKFAAGYVRLADTLTFQLSNFILSFVFTIILLTPRAPMVVMILIAFSLVFVVTSIKISRRIRELSAIEAAAENTQTGYLADAISNILAVKSFAANDFEQCRYNDATITTAQASTAFMRTGMRRDMFYASSTWFITTCSLVTATTAVVVSHADVATVFLVVTYTAVIAQELWEFSQSTLRNISRVLGDAQEMTAILHILPAVADPARSEKIAIVRGAISFRTMAFTHGDSKAGDSLFESLSLDIAAGEKIGLVGRSGSGKTTLTKLLLRFYDIDGGQILIDGQDISRITQNDLRQHIAYVPQEPLLFHRSLRENIAYGRPDASQEQIEAAARKAHAHEFITKLPGGYDTLVGERGVKLSGGQRQRIAIARAILKDAPILLLDEATSALDSESEQLIQSALWELMSDRTTIVIAHRLSTIQRMDRIVVLDNGRIAEQGSHQQLLVRGGIYASLWAHQSGGFIEE